MADNAIVSQGTKLWRGEENPVTKSITWTKVNSVSGFSGPNTSKTKIDVTDFDSKRKKSLQGIPDDGDVSFNLYFNPADATHRAIVTEDVPASGNRPWRLEFSDGTIFEFMGNVSGAPLSGALDGVVTWNVTITVSDGGEGWLFKSLGKTITWDSTLAGTEGTGAVTGSVKATLSATDGTSPKFKTGSFVAGGDYVLTQVPEGLTGALARTSDTVATLTFTGTATVKYDVTDIRLEFKDTAFQGGLRAIEVSGSIKPNIAITFV